MSSAIPHRIDRPAPGDQQTSGHHLPTPAAPARIGVSTRSQVPESAESVVRATSPTGSGDSGWLQLHAAELISRLQAWAADLDAREAQLNARSALDDHRQRTIRLQLRDQQAELAEQAKSLQRLQQELQAHARRLAFQPDPDGAKGR